MPGIGIEAAFRSASAGLDVVLVEGRAGLGEGAICSGVIGEEAFPRFDLPTDAVLTSIRRIQAISPAGKKLEHRSEVPLARVVDKKAFSRALGEHARAVGVQVQLDRLVESLEHDKHSVTLRFRSLSGGRAVLRAQAAVIASGVNGSLNRLLGLARPRQIHRAMQGEVTLPNEGGLPPTRVYVGRSIAPGAFGWQIPLGQGRVRVGIMTTQDPKRYLAALLHRVSPTLDESRVSTSQKGIAQGAVGRCTADRLVAVEEAAGHVKTSTGGGIYYGLLSGEFVAEALCRACRKGDFTAKGLEDFERYWRAAFGNELLVGYFARELASCFPDRVIERIFEMANSSNLLGQLDGRLKFDWHQRALLTTLRSIMFHSRGMGHV